MTKSILETVLERYTKLKGVKNEKEGRKKTENVWICTGS
jgi:hypothetical protein